MNGGVSELYELLHVHGISTRICEIFKGGNVDCKKFSTMCLDGEDYKKLKERLNEKFPNMIISDDEARHLFSILVKYKRSPNIPKHKLIADNVHGQINVHPLLVKIIDTPQFQRLRYLKQLGTTCYVYPTAVHSRFEHCIGTSHIAGLFIEHLKKSQPALEISLSDELCIRIAGLCHDLGHGPFSHMFEEVIKVISPDDSWQHEMTTLKLIDKMALGTNLEEEFNSYGLFEKDIEFIKDLIHASIFKSADPATTYGEKLSKLPSLEYKGKDKSFLYEIISNNRSGIDVDKFDYFERDCLALGFKNNFDYKRYIACTRVIETDDGLNEICIRDKDIRNVYEMFHVRELLTRRAYKHETGSSINLMIVDALVKAEKYFDFKKMIQENDIDRFVKLNDNIFLEVLYSDDPRLKESREILERVEKRMLYKYIGSTVLPNDKNGHAKDLKAELIEYIANSQIKKENIEVEIVRFNYSFKNKNPIDYVKCYNKHSPNYAFKMEKNEISGMLLNQFEDVEIRLYCKIADDSVIDLFFKWCYEKRLRNPVYGAKRTGN